MVHRSLGMRIIIIVIIIPTSGLHQHEAGAVNGGGGGGGAHRAPVALPSSSASSSQRWKKVNCREVEYAAVVCIGAQIHSNLRILLSRATLLSRRRLPFQLKRGQLDIPQKRRARCKFCPKGTLMTCLWSPIAPICVCVLRGRA